MCILASFMLFWRISISDRWVKYREKPRETQTDCVKIVAKAVFVHNYGVFV